MNNYNQTPKPYAGFFIMLIFISLFSMVYYSMITKTGLPIEITYQKFQELVDKNALVGNVNVTDTLVHGKFQEKMDKDSPPLLKEPQNFILNVNLKTDTEFLKELKQKKVLYIYRQEKDASSFSSFLLFALAFVAVVVLFRLMGGRSSGSNSRSGGGFPGLGGMSGFMNDSNFRIVRPEEIKVSFKDVQGIDEVKEEVQEIIDFISNPEKYEKMGATIPHGILLNGAPGTGKTMLAKAIAKESGSAFISASGSEFIEMFVGLGAKRVRSLFSTARELALKSKRTCIIFIDEIDAVGGKRGVGIGSGGNSEQEQTLNQLLTEMDGFATVPGHVVVIAATNRVESLDSALRRKGRFDREVTVPMPTIEGRKKILEVHTTQMKKIPLGASVNLDKVARGTSGFTGAQLEALVNEAAILAARAGRDLVEHQDFENARDKAIMGVEQKSLVLNEVERKHVAVHEAGHAFLSIQYKKYLDPLHKVSIVPRGNALGVTMSLPDVERTLNYSKDKCEAMIGMMMGGRIAEQVCFEGNLTSGASNDIERATQLARGMVQTWGMSELGPINFESDSQFNHKFSEGIREKVDQEVMAIVRLNYDKAYSLIEKNKEKILKIADLLLLKETVDAEEIEALLI